ncbi:hypothetical protein, partial [Candidatus Ichthyocystis sparus]|uniref:hypothetical protein n=2 Tax=Candidatus Ichthyocystis sparus TaxID=1561004 RepID=UPI00159EF3CB
HWQAPGSSQVLLDSIEAPQPQVAPAVVVEGGDTTHWQAPGSSQVLLDSIEAPQPQVAPAVVVEGGDTTHWQAPGSSAPEQSTGGSVLAPDLARLEQRMYTIHLLRRSMLRSAPPPKTVKKREGKEEKLRRKEQEKEEKLRKKRQEKEKRLGEKEANKEIAATKSRERELGMVISVAVCREAELERVRVKVLEVPELLSSRRKRDIEMVEARERELRKVLAEPRPEDMQEMKKELEKVRARCKELEQAGAGEVLLNIDSLRIKETRVRADLESAVAREIKVKNLEKELEVLVARELDLETIEIGEVELGKVKTKKIKIEKDLMKLRSTIAMTEGSIELELKLGELIKEREMLEATIDVVKRGAELNRLKEGAKSKLGERELEMMLRLAGINVRVRVLELELGLLLGKIIAKKIEAEKIITSIVPDGSEISRAEREVGSIATPEVVPEVMVMQESEEEVVVEGEEGASSVNIVSTREKEEMAATKSRERELEMSISAVVCREIDLEKVRCKVRGIIKMLGVPGSLISRKKDMNMMEAKEIELRRVIAEPRPEDLQKMEKELAEVGERYKELEQAGAGEVLLNIDYLRIKETRVRADLGSAVAREMKVKNLEKELEVLVARELGLEGLDRERIGIRKGELDEVRTKKIKIGEDLTKLRATIAITGGSLELGLKLGELIKERERMEATIDGVKRGIEINRLKEGAKVKLGERELELMLRLEGINARVRLLELELGLLLGKIVAKKIETEKVMTSGVLGGSGISRAERAGGSSTETPGVVPEVIVEGEGGASSINVVSAREIEEERVIVMKIRERELELEEAVRLERPRGMGETAITASREELELELGGVRAQERNLGLELDRVRAHAMNLDRGIWEVGVISEATSAEIEAKRDRLKELNRNRSLARVRELELRIGLSRARLRARRLVLALEKLKVVEQDQN